MTIALDQVPKTIKDAVPHSHTRFVCIMDTDIQIWHVMDDEDYYHETMVIVYWNTNYDWDPTVTAFKP